MIKDENRGKKNYKSDNKPESSTNAPEICKCKKDSDIYKGASSKLYESPSGLQARPNSPQNETIEKGGNKENGRSTCVLHATLQSVEKVTANESEMATSKDGDNSACDNQAAAQVEGKSKKTRKRRRGKSILDTSGSESFPSAGHENQKLGSTNIASSKDTDFRTFCDNKAFDYRDLITRRITQIESNLTGSKSEVNKKHMIAGNKSRTSFEKEKTILGPFRYYVPPKEPSTAPSIRPIIFIADKATQTDPAPGPLSISKSTDGKNSASLNSDSNGSIVTEPTSLLPVEETNAETVSEHTDTLEDRIGLHSSSFSSVEDIPSIAELLKILEIDDGIDDDEFREWFGYDQ